MKAFSKSLKNAQIRRSSFLRMVTSPAASYLTERYFQRLRYRLSKLDLTPIQRLHWEPSYVSILERSWERTRSYAARAAQKKRSKLQRRPSFRIGPSISMPDDFFAAFGLRQETFRIKQTVRTFVNDLFLEFKPITYKQLWRKLSKRLVHVGATNVIEILDPNDFRAARYDFSLEDEQGKHRCSIRFSDLQRICAHPSAQKPIG